MSLISKSEKDVKQLQHDIEATRRAMESLRKRVEANNLALRKIETQLEEASARVDRWSPLDTLERIARESDKITLE